MCESESTPLFNKAWLGQRASSSISQIGKGPGRHAGAHVDAQVRWSVYAHSDVT